MNFKVQKGVNKYSKIFSVLCVPEGDPIGIVYFAHGATEYAERNAELFEYLVAAGYIVIANDHMGHGRSTSKARTYFTSGNDKTGWECAAEDAFRLINITREKYPGLPVHGIGFSLGSYLIRFLAMKYHYLFKTITLIGTGYQNSLTTYIGKIVARKQCEKFGCTERSELIDELSFGKYNNHFKDKNSNDMGYSRALWLYADERAQKEYVEDSRITAGFTTGLFLELLEAIEYTCDEKHISKLRSDCPVLLLSGTDDASGNFGKGINTLEKIYRRNNLRVRKIFYEKARHDILHDFCKEKVFENIKEFLCENT